MWLFTHKRKAVASNGSDRVAGKITKAIQVVQYLFAEKMHKIFSMMSIGNRKRIVILFCVLSFGFCLYLIVDALLKPSKESIGIEQIKKPKHFDKTGAEVIPTDNYVDDETYQNIQVYKHFLDSLKHKNSALYDSIQSQRPGLMDSILVLEQLYYSQQQNSVYEK